MLQDGELMPSDLVFSSGSWTTFEQSAEFFEACEGQVDTRAQWGNAKNIIRFVVGLVLAAIVIAMLLAGCTTGTGRNAYRQKAEAIGTSLRALDHSYGIVARHVELSAEGAWADDQGMESSSEAIAALSGALES
jgi:outer membrane murein-binding lipoprotein Lpp